MAKSQLRRSTNSSSSKLYFPAHSLMSRIFCVFLVSFVFATSALFQKGVLNCMIQIEKKRDLDRFLYLSTFSLLPAISTTFGCCYSLFQVSLIKQEFSQIMKALQYCLLFFHFRTLIHDFSCLNSILICFGATSTPTCH